MKKLLAILTTLFFLTTISSCTSQNVKTNSAKNLQIELQTGTIVSSQANEGESTSGFTVYTYMKRSRGNDSFIEIDTVNHTLTTYNTINNKAGTKHVAQYEGEYPQKITAYFESLDATIVLTFSYKRLTKYDSRGFTSSFELYATN